MIEPSLHKRIDHLDDPERCQAMAGSNQCLYKHVPNSEYCDLHGGNNTRQQAAKEANRMYMLAQWQARIGQFSDHSDLKSLRAEIGILRILIEKKFQSCKTDNDLLLRSGSISELVMKVTKCVSECDRIDARLGKMVDEQKLLEIGNEIVTLISKFVTEPEQLQTISREMVGIMASRVTNN